MICHLRSLIFVLLTFSAFQAFADDPVLKFTMKKADGTSTAYEFLVPSDAVAATEALPREAEVQRQHNAGVVALSWAKQFYAAHRDFHALG